ncbi:hypothetical protein AJ80_02298 [Polytolypa hystricis UAMH7299]|uniref:Tho complex subunit 7 n=1 Tax=Polytolypa hystricis (strain UAMH7299) TaxID=1447883 RepID=A0A2B7YS51_POLH7|nr:hypothetical protein AJ80_02298 [Polytolypa hystricis UAMH7299]
MSSYSLLDQPDEDALHKSRLLNVEEKPFKRITKRLLTPNSLVTSPAACFPTPPPEADADRYEAESKQRLEEWRQFREDVILDFSAFDSSIARIQFLLTSNEKERQRYAAEKSQILATAQSVKDNTAELRTQLEEAQRTLALRKSYDELAEKITSNRLLRPREDQQANLAKLHAEIEKLEMESKEYATTWSERRAQFGRIVEEGMNLRRLIRDEKEEVERREGMEEGEEGDEADMGSKGRSSAVGTPRPEPDGATPSQPSQDDTLTPGGVLQLEKLRGGVGDGISPLRQGVNASSKSATPAVQQDEDENMVDEGEVTGDESALPESSSIAARTRAGSRVASEVRDPTATTRLEDKMDTT